MYLNTTELFPTKSNICLEHVESLILSLLGDPTIKTNDKQIREFSRVIIISKTEHTGKPLFLITLIF